MRALGGYRAFVLRHISDVGDDEVHRHAADQRAALPASAEKHALRDVEFAVSRAH